MSKRARNSESPLKRRKLEPSHKITQIKNVHVLRGDRFVEEDLWIMGDQIIDPQKRFWEARDANEFMADEVLSARGLYACPGFIDVQINGAFGVDFSSPQLTKEDVVKVSRGLVKYGVTSLCPTVVTSSPDLYRKVLPLLKQEPGNPQRGATILGAHLEGPFINPEKRGAHNPSLICTPKNGASSLTECYGSLENIAIVTLAPELSGADKAIKALKSSGVVVSIGHSMASVDQAEKAVECGATLITHLFNAMGSFHHRDPGMIGLLGTVDHQPFYSIIVDGIHSHPTSIKIAHKAHPSGTILVTDAMAALGLPPGVHSLGELSVDVCPDRAVLSGTTTLAGSIAPLDDCIRKFKSFTGCSSAEAILAATLHPARVLGIENRKGSLHFGSDADIVFLDENLEIRSVWIAGEEAWHSIDCSLYSK